MDPLKLASGDNNNICDDSTPNEEHSINAGSNDEFKVMECDQDEKSIENEITPQLIDDNESKLKERITQCRNIIESLKLELNEEKAKLDKDSKLKSTPILEATPSYHNVTVAHNFMAELTYNSRMYSSYVDNKLVCDENLIEYEKQLQKYQNTLNMAQIEKKNAIRKQMLAKAYRLKLLEVENQCNIELLRVKQSLQCLEPLQMIANKWKLNSESSVYDYNFELISRYPEINANSLNESNSYKEDDGVSIKVQANKLENATEDNYVLSED